MTSNRFLSSGFSVRSVLAFGVAVGASGTFGCSSDTTTPKTTTTDAGSGTGGRATGSGGSKSTGGGTSSGGAQSGGNGGTSTAGAGNSAGGSKAGTGGAGTDSGPGLVSLVVTQTNLVADLPNVAPTVDPNLLNPWGLVPNPSGPFWVSDNHSGLATVYDPAGGPSKLNVKVPGPAGVDGGFTSSPTGQVFNATAADFKGDKFIFDAEDGTVSGWQGGAVGVLRVDNSADSGYKGLAIIKNGTAGELVAANFHKGTVDVFDATYAPIANPGFVDAGTPALPAGFAAFNVASLGGKVYISYAKQDAEKGDDTPGPGNGYVSVFKTDGTFQKRLVSGGDLNSPWGLELAPSSFGALAGTLLVGNFGNGAVHAYDVTTGELLGSLAKSGGPLIISGLWALVVGPKTSTTDYSGSVYFTAGPGGEDNGIFGKLEVK
jgi:uncharacterized protein (TIGR03118 family)